MRASVRVHSCLLPLCLPINPKATLALSTNEDGRLCVLVCECACVVSVWQRLRLTSSAENESRVVSVCQQ